MRKIGAQAREMLVGRRAAMAGGETEMLGGEQ
jgi:hypothetical protein